MIGSAMATLAAALLAAVAVATLALLVGGALLWRAARRRWRALRAGAEALGVFGAWESLRSRRCGSGPVDVAATGAWSPRRARRELRGRVRSAEEAVALADRSGAPTAELPALCRRLHAAAAHLDETLALEGSAVVPPATARQVADLLGAADALRRAALDSVTETHDLTVQELLADASAEGGLLAAGARSRARTLPPPH